ncbi:hypothetical protein TrVE_jg10177 [Triparma verrucosa]|uniref:Major facilitator superfamily (MFS) profile domain-containing protein n=1 Tax=Triparma verrucosa TaxID=1606542 RepID=A0A9W7BEV3_9STRA|nr:hypothetical protein TrVE_jg10177 [Triparma verrucosa]
MLIIGTLMYASSGTPMFVNFLMERLHKSSGLFLLISGQFVMGLGSGTLGVTRAYVAESTGREERTKWLSWLTAVQYTGFTVMPVVGAVICNGVKEGGWVEGGRVWLGGVLVLNEYTMPAFFMTAVAGVTLGLLLTVFEDKKREKKEGKKNLTVETGSPAAQDWSGETVLLGLSRFDATVLGCMLLNVATKGSIAVYETLTVNFATSHFVEMDSEAAGYVVSSCGAMGVVALLGMGQIGKVLTDTQMITYGMATMIVGTALLVHFGDHRHFGKYRFESAVFLLYSVGYPIGHTAVIGIFSKIVGKRPQGALLGYFASAGSVARMFFPIFSGYVAQFLGNSVMFCFLIGVLGVATLIVVTHRETLRRLSTE